MSLWSPSSSDGSNTFFFPFPFDSGFVFVGIDDAGGFFDSPGRILDVDNRACRGGTEESEESEKEEASAFPWTKCVDAAEGKEDETVKSWDWVEIDEATRSFKADVDPTCFVKLGNGTAE